MGYNIKLFNLWVVLYAGLGSTACAYSLAVLGSTIGQPSFYTSLHLAAQGEPGYGRTTNLLGAINGVNSAGAALGALFNAWSADRFSRKYTIQIGAVILVIGAGIGAGSVDVEMLMVSRFISGWGIGIIISVIPMYQSEISTPETRGFMVSMYGVMGATGYALSSWVGLGFYFVSAGGSTSSFAWRFPLAFQAVPAMLLLVGSPWLPFSPRWLAEQDRFEEAEAVLKRLHARKGESNHEQARKELFQIREQLKLDREIGKNASRFEIFKTGPNRKRLLVTVILTWGAIFTGPLVMASYGIILFIQLGISGFMPIALLGIWTTVAIPGNLISAFCIDRFGRRTFLLIGAIGVLITLVFECALQARYTGTANRSGQIAAIFFIYVFIVVYTIFIDATQWVYLSEIYPTHIRGLGVGIGLFNWFGSSIILQVAGPIALDKIGWRFFFILIIPTAFYAVGIYLIFPETAKKSLEDINAEFGEVVAVRYSDVTTEDKKKYRTAIEVEDVSSEIAATVEAKV